MKKIKKNGKQMNIEKNKKKEVQKKLIVKYVV